MIIKLTIVNTKSQVFFKTAITKYPDTTTIAEVLLSKNVTLSEVIEVKSGYDDKLVTIDRDCF